MASAIVEELRCLADGFAGSESEISLNAAHGGAVIRLAKRHGVGLNLKKSGKVYKIAAPDLTKLINKIMGEGTIQVPEDVTPEATEEIISTDDVSDEDVEGEGDELNETDLDASDELDGEENITIEGDETEGTEEDGSKPESGSDNAEQPTHNTRNTRKSNKPAKPKVKKR